MVKGDLAELECLTEITGNLTIELEPDAPSSNHTLRTVGGALRLEGKDTRASFTLSALETAGELVVEGTELRELAWPLLRTVSGSVRIGPCHEVGGDDGAGYLECNSNSKLKSISFPALDSVGLLALGDNPKLVSFEAPSLRETGDIQIPECDPITNDDREVYDDVCTDLPVLASLDLRSLEHAGDIHLGSARADDCSYGYCGQVPRLKDFALPSLVDATSVTVGDVSALDRLEFPLLLATEWLEVRCHSDRNNELSVDLEHLGSVERIDVECPVSISAPSLQSAASLNLVGSAQGPLRFPALTELGYFALRSYDLEAFDCASVFPSLPTDEYPSMSLTGDALVSFDCSLVRRAGDLSLTGMRVPEVSFAALTNVTQLYLANLPELTELSVPALAEAILLISEVPKLATFEAPALEQSGSFEIVQAESLTTLNLPKLSVVVGLVKLDAIPKLNHVNLDGLTETVAFILLDSGLTALTLPAFTTVAEVTLVGNPGLISFSAALLGPSVNTIALRDNAVLTLPTLPALTSASQLQIENSPAISECDAYAWAAALGAVSYCYNCGACAP